MILFQKKCEKGFTLVEALVAITVLTMALIPTLLLANSSRTTAQSIRHNLIAANLAQEGVEIVRALRDNNWFASPPQAFSTGLSAGTYEVEWDSTSLQADQDRFLTLTPEGVYEYGAATVTPYKRKIVITTVSAGEVRVESQVTWQDTSGLRTTVVESHLFNWYE